MTITVPKSGLIPLEALEKLIDISKVVYYDLEEKDGIIKLKFYDKNEKLVKPYGEENEKEVKKVRKSKVKKGK